MAEIIEREIINATTEFQRSGTRVGGWVYRGNTTANDFTVGDFTTDATWNVLDINSGANGSVVPLGATAAQIRLLLKDGTVGIKLEWRGAGNANSNNALSSIIQVANVSFADSGVIPLNSAGNVEYWGTNTTWTTISVIIMAWFI